MKIQIIWDESAAVWAVASARWSVRLPSWPIARILRAAASRKTLDVFGSNFGAALLACCDGRKQISSSTELILWDCCILCLRCEAVAVGSRDAPRVPVCWRELMPAQCFFFYFFKQNKNTGMINCMCRRFSTTNYFQYTLREKTQSFTHHGKNKTGTTFDGSPSRNMLCSFCLCWEDFSRTRRTPHKCAPI